jgi:hypothetical protein
VHGGIAIKALSNRMEARKLCLKLDKNPLKYEYLPKIFRRQLNSPQPHRKKMHFISRRKEKLCNKNYLPKISPSQKTVNFSLSLPPGFLGFPITN